MLLNLIKQSIQEDPLLTIIDLSGQNITALDQVSLDLLSRLKNLQKLDLQDNQIQKLPKNLSYLKNISELNLNGNPIEDIKAATESLRSIGSGLKSLNINLYEEDQVDHLLRCIEWLEILNGLKVERDALFNNEEDESGDSNRQEDYIHSKRSADNQINKLNSNLKRSQEHIVGSSVSFGEGYRKIEQRQNDSLSNNGKLIESFNQEFQNSNNLAYLIDDNQRQNFKPSSSIKLVEKSMKYQNKDENDQLYQDDIIEYQYQNKYDKIDLQQLMQPSIPESYINKHQIVSNSESFYAHNRMAHEMDSHFQPSNIVSDRQPPITMINSSEMFSQRLNLNNNMSQNQEQKPNYSNLGFQKNEQARSHIQNNHINQNSSITQNNGMKSSEIQYNSRMDSIKFSQGESTYQKFQQDAVSLLSNTNNNIFGSSEDRQGFQNQSEISKMQKTMNQNHGENYEKHQTGCIAFRSNNNKQDQANNNFQKKDQSSYSQNQLYFQQNEQNQQTQFTNNFNSSEIENHRFINDDIPLSQISQSNFQQTQDLRKNLNEDAMPASLLMTNEPPLYSDNIDEQKKFGSDATIEPSEIKAIHEAQKRYSNNIQNIYDTRFEIKRQGKEDEGLLCRSSQGNTIERNFIRNINREASVDMQNSNILREEINRTDIKQMNRNGGDLIEISNFKIQGISNSSCAQQNLAKPQNYQEHKYINVSNQSADRKLSSDFVNLKREKVNSIIDQSNLILVNSDSHQRRDASQKRQSQHSSNSISHVSQKDHQLNQKFHQKKSINRQKEREVLSEKQLSISRVKNLEDSRHEQYHINSQQSINLQNNRYNQINQISESQLSNINLNSNQNVRKQNEFYVQKQEKDFSKNKNNNYMNFYNNQFQEQAENSQEIKIQNQNQVQNKNSQNLMKNSISLLSKETIQNSFEGLKSIQQVENITTPVYKDQVPEITVSQSANTRTDIKKIENLHSEFSQYRLIDASNKSNFRDILNEQEALILESCLSASVEPLPKLQELNLNETELNSTDLESIAIVYDKIRLIFKQFVIQRYLQENFFAQKGYCSDNTLLLQNLAPKDTQELLAEATELAQKIDLNLANDFDQNLTLSMKKLNHMLREIAINEKSILEKYSNLINNELLTKENHNQQKYENDEFIAQKSFYKTSCFPFFTNLRNFLKKQFQQQRQSLILEQKQKLVKLCIDKTFEFFNQIQNSSINENSLQNLNQQKQQISQSYKTFDQIKIQSYLKALESILQNLFNYQDQMQQRNIEYIQGLGLGLIQQTNQSSGVSLNDILDFVDHSQDEIRELSASFELKDLEVRAIQLKLTQKEEEVEKMKRLLNNQIEKNHKLKEQQEESFNVNQVAQQFENDQQNGDNQMQSRQMVYSNSNKNDIVQKDDYNQTFFNSVTTNQIISQVISNQISKIGSFIGNKNGEEERDFQVLSPKLLAGKQIHSDMKSSVKSQLNKNASANLSTALKQFNSSINQNQNGSISNLPHQKVLPLKQLKDIIQDIYSQKVKYDSKCNESQLPLETMEQFLYTYLNQKYGLKTLIVEQASNLITGIKCYLHDDHEVTLFAKILKNECDEEFRYVQMHVKQTLSNLLKITLREKYPMKRNSQLSQEQFSIQNSLIEENLWKKILNKMYEQNDVLLLTERFQIIINNKKLINNDFQQKAANLTQNQYNTLDNQIGYYMSKKMQMQKYLVQNNKENSKILINKQIYHMPRKSKSKQRLSREQESMANQKKQKQDLLYIAEFEKQILDFQLQEHERFLKEFNRLFKNVDRNCDGIINEQEFRELILSMNVVVQNLNDPNQDIEALLKIVDPFNNQVMNYSQVVQLLSNQLVPQRHPMNIQNNYYLNENAGTDLYNNNVYQNQNNDLYQENDIQNNMENKQMNESQRGFSKMHGINNQININSDNCFSSNQQSMKKYTMNPFAPESTQLNFINQQTPFLQNQMNQSKQISLNENKIINSQWPINNDISSIDCGHNTFLSENQFQNNKLIPILEKFFNYNNEGTLLNSKLAQGNDNTEEDQISTQRSQNNYEEAPQGQHIFNPYQQSENKGQTERQQDEVEYQEQLGDNNQEQDTVIMQQEQTADALQYPGFKHDSQSNYYKQSTAQTTKNTYEDGCRQIKNLQMSQLYKMQKGYKQNDQYSQNISNLVHNQYSVSQCGLTTNGYSISGGMKGQQEEILLNHDISGIRGILEGNESKEDDIFQNFSENQSQFNHLQKDFDQRSAIQAQKYMSGNSYKNTYGRERQNLQYVQRQNFKEIDLQEYQREGYQEKYLKQKSQVINSQPIQVYSNQEN